MRILSPLAYVVTVGVMPFAVAVHGVGFNKSLSLRCFHLNYLGSMALSILCLGLYRCSYHCHKGCYSENSPSSCLQGHPVAELFDAPH
jgi:hypothetical protein